VNPTIGLLEKNCRLGRASPYMVGNIEGAKVVDLGR